MDSMQTAEPDGNATVHRRDLLACPFCGSTPRRVQAERRHPKGEARLWQVECSSGNCGAKTMPSHYLEAAEASWNRRASLGLELLNGQAAELAPTPAPGQSHSRQVVDQMLAYVHRHYSRPMHLADVAAALRMNVAYLSALFSNTTGVTFHAYLEQVRLAKAKALLRDPSQRVSEVAYAVGYANPNYFRDAFKARIGTAPSVWRTRTPG